MIGDTTQEILLYVSVIYVFCAYHLGYNNRFAVMTFLMRDASSNKPIFSCGASFLKDTPFGGEFHFL